MKHFLTLALTTAVLASASAAHAQADALQARSWAAACANCHGTGGHAQAGSASLAGVSKDALLKKLLDFKSGATPSTVMGQLSKGYSDAQLGAIAAWFAAQPK